MRQHLLAIYEASLTHFNATVRDLVAATAMPSGQERLRSAACNEAAKTQVQQARAAYDDHVRDHGCKAPDYTNFPIVAASRRHGRPYFGRLY